MGSLYTAIGLFAAAALGGIYLLSFILRNRETPKSIALIHGLFAALGLVFLFYYAAVSKPAPIDSAILLVLAALGGFVLIFRDLTGKNIPKWLAVGHGLIAVTGFILLVIFAINR
jgi:hypothetical protein